MKKIGWGLMTLLALMSPGGLSAGPREAKAGPAPFVARLSLTDGTSRTVSLQGVGCSETLCSRAAVRSRIEGDPRVTRTFLDTIAVIKDITRDSALFVFKDRTERRQSVIADNRILYLVNQNGGEAKIDLARVTSIEFLEVGRSTP